MSMNIKDFISYLCENISDITKKDFLSTLSFNQLKPWVVNLHDNTLIIAHLTLEKKLIKKEVKEEKEGNFKNTSIMKAFADIYGLHMPNVNIKKEMESFKEKILNLNFNQQLSY